MSGLFICIDGIDGSGKSTQTALLAKRIRKIGTCHEIADSDATLAAEKVQELVKSGELFGIEATGAIIIARAANYRKVIRPAIGRGEHVVSDRFLATSYAYHYEGGGWNFITHLHKTFCEGYILPDLTIILDTDVETAQARLKGRLYQDAWDGANRDVWQARKQAYLNYVSNHKDTVVVDGNQPVREVKFDIWGYVEPLMKAQDQMPQYLKDLQGAT